VRKRSVLPLLIAVVFSDLSLAGNAALPSDWAPGKIEE
jgi:hypothetical protein